MKIYDSIEKVDKDLTSDEMLELVAHHNRQIYLYFDEERKDADGYVTYDEENWVSPDGKKFIRCYALKGKVSMEAPTYNFYDMKGYFVPEEASKVVLS